MHPNYIIKKLEMKKQLFLSVVLTFMAIFAKAQEVNIHELMQRNDLTMNQIESIAEAYFAKVGRVRGTGYKQYERWKQEQQFHLREDGTFIGKEEESRAYQMALPTLRANANAERKSPTPWKELGPSSWTRTSGWNPGVGRLTSVAIHPSNENIIYVSSPGGGLWKTTDGAKSWSPLVDTINSAWMDFFNLAIAPTEPNTIYAGLNTGGVLKSIDAGLTWVACAKGPVAIRKIIIHPTSADTLFAAASNGIYRSVDGGNAWTSVQSGGFQDIEFLPNSPDIMIASASSDLLYRSANEGLTWSKYKLPASGRTLLAVSPNNNKVVYAVQARANIFGRLYRSDDAGLTFKTTIAVENNTWSNFFGYSTTAKDSSGQATYDMGICVNPKNEDEVHIAGIICWKSINGGKNFAVETAWNLPNTIGYNHADVHGLEWINDNIYSISDGGVYVSKNQGDDWTDLSSGLGIRQLYRIACAKTNGEVVTGGAQDNGTTYRKPDGSWLEWLGADGMDGVISPTNANVAIGTSQYGSIYKTTDGGLTQKSLKRPTTLVNNKETQVTGKWITPIAFHPNSHDTVYGGWDGVYRSDNGGTKWTKLTQNVSTGLLDFLVVAPSDANYIYAGTSGRLYRTSNGGETWTSATGLSNITSVCVSPSNPEKIWVTTGLSSNNVKVSNNMGTTFTNISAGLPSMAARSVVVDNERTEGLYVGMNVGVYYKDNVNTKWVLHAPGLPLVAVNEVELQQSSRKIRVATYGRGVWESEMQDVPPSVNAGANVTLNCTKKDALLTATGGISYRWNTGEAAASINVSPTITTTYKVTATMSDSTETTDEVIVKVDNATPNVTILNSNGLALDCNKISTTLTAIGGTSYVWNDGANTDSRLITTGNTFTVTATATNGCTASKSETTTFVPATSDTSKINACYQYTWGINKEMYRTSGIYSQKKNCHTHYLILNITPTPTNGIVFSPCDTSNLTIASNTLRCFPNPFGNELNLYFNLGDSANDVVFKIYDMQGRFLASSVQGNLNAGDYALRWNLSDLSNGVYNVCMEIEQKCFFVERVMVLK